MNTEPAASTLAKGVAVSMVLAVILTGGYFYYDKSFKGVQETAGATKDGTFDAIEKGYGLAKLAAKDVRRALGFEPRVTVGSATIFGPAVQTTEVVTAAKDFEHAYLYEVTWAGSTKRLELKGSFNAKAGFTVDDSFAIDMSEDGKSVVLRHKTPRLISCEMMQLRVLKDENGWWNTISSTEREKAQNILLQQAREAASKSDLMTTATEELLKRLSPLHRTGLLTVRDEIIP